MGTMFYIPKIFNECLREREFEGGIYVEAKNHGPHTPPSHPADPGPTNQTYLVLILVPVKSKNLATEGLAFFGLTIE